MMASVSGSLQPEGCALARDRVSDADGGLQAMQYALHDVHADAAAGDFGDLFGRAESGAKDEVESLGFGEPRGFFRRRQAKFDGLCANLLRVDAATVVGDFDDDLVAVVIGVQPHDSLRQACPACGAHPADSIPWLIALRTRCVSGSAIASRMPLSRSVSCPLTESSTSLPHCRETSRTIRGKRRNS